METHYSEALVFTRSEDGLGQDGLVIRPVDGESLGVVVWIHGAACNFADQPYVLLGRELARRQITFLSGDTRGHDAAALYMRGDDVIPAGTIWERLDEAPLDIAPWIDFAVSLGFERIVLAGHSLAASKAIYYQAQRQDERLRGVIAASPSVFGFPATPERIALAQGMVEDGRGEELLPPPDGAPAWLLISAQTLASHEEVVRRAFRAEQAEPWVALVRCPLLAFYGTSESETTQSLEIILNNAGGPCETQTIQNADHFYTGREREVARTIAGWMRGL